MTLSPESETYDLSGMKIRVIALRFDVAIGSKKLLGGLQVCAFGYVQQGGHGHGNHCFKIFRLVDLHHLIPIQPSWLPNHIFPTLQTLKLCNTRSLLPVVSIKLQKRVIHLSKIHIQTVKNSERNENFNPKIKKKSAQNLLWWSHGRAPHRYSRADRDHFDRLCTIQCFRFY